MFKHVVHPGLRALLSFEATKHKIAMEYREVAQWVGALPPFAPRIDVLAYCGNHPAPLSLPVAGGAFSYEGPYLPLQDIETLHLPQDDGAGTPVCGVTGNRVLVFLSLETLFRQVDQVPRETPDPMTPTVNPAHQVFDAIMSWALPLAIANIGAHDWQAEAAEFTRMKMEVLDRSMRDWREQVARNERDIEEKTWEIRNLVTGTERLREALARFQEHTRMQHRRRAAEEHAELVKMLAAGAIRNLRCGDDGIDFECGPMTIEFNDYDYSLGPFKVSVNVPDASFRVTGMPGCPKAEGYVHPHVASGGTPCMGNAGPMIAKTLGVGDVVGAVNTILEFLRSYPVATLIAAIDKVLGEHWSFDLLHHEVVGDETIVFTRLVVDGRHRVGIGGTTRQGPLVDRLNDAALHALTRAAAWMCIPAATTAAPQPTPEPVPATTPAESTARITRKQLDYAISLARDRGVARDKLTSHCLAEFGRKPEYLTRAEASALIESLKNKEAA